MAATILCQKGDCKDRRIRPHCTSPACPWAKCPVHGVMALAPDDRRRLHGGN